MGSNPIVASTMSTFQWRETLKSIRPPLFTRLGCSFAVIVLTLNLAALLVGGLFVLKNFHTSFNDKEAQDFLAAAMSLTVFLAPMAAFVFAIFAFFESVDFLVWLKLPLYPPPPAPKPDPLEAFKAPKG